jgi:predicted RNase H-like HicB family nuclease
MTDLSGEVLGSILDWEHDTINRPGEPDGKSPYEWVDHGLIILRTGGCGMNYKIAIHRTDEGISVSVPALPGCWSEGDTEEEALANIQDAIREYLAALEDRFKDAEVREVEVQV